MSEMQTTNEYYQTENNYPQLSNKQKLILNSDNVQIIQKVFKVDIKEIGPTTQDINKTIFEEDLNILIDELVNLYFDEVLNKGKEKNARKKFVLDYFNNHEINLQEIYNWLL